MPLYQNTGLNDSKNLVIGNYKIETSVYASAGGSHTWVNVGAGMVNSFNHQIEKYDVQAGNAPDPIKGISRETFKISLELIELDLSVMAAISCGGLSYTSGASVLTASGGGAAELTPIAFRLTNRRLISSVTKETIIIVPYATIDNGLAVTAKSDNDANPINVYPVEITGDIDGTRTVGSQLYTITRDV